MMPAILNSYINIAASSVADIACPHGLPNPLAHKYILVDYEDFVSCSQNGSGCRYKNYSEVVKKKFVASKIDVKNAL